jgi:hypothetical protein
LEKLDGMFKGLKEGDIVDTLTELLAAYETSMLPHFEQEEVECLPLMRAYFTPEEIGPKIQEIVGNGPKVSVILSEDPHSIPAFV